MRCPCCGGRIKKNENMCVRCGTKLKDIENASHQAVKQAIAEYTPEKVVLTTVWPKDLSFRNTLLMCIFFGLFGGHYFYVKRKVPGFIYLAIWCIFLVFTVISSQYTTDDLIPHFESHSLEVLYGFACFGGAMIAILWIMDIIKIVLKHFNVPVVLDTKNNKGRK